MHPIESLIAPLVKGTEEPLFSEREMPFIFPRNEVMIFTYGNSMGTTIKGMNHSTWDVFQKKLSLLGVQTCTSLIITVRGGFAGERMGNSQETAVGYVGDIQNTSTLSLQLIA